MYELPKQKGAMQVGVLSMGTMKQQGGGGGRNFVQNQSKSLWSMDFEGRGRAQLNFVQLDKMFKMCIPFLLFTLTWQKFRPKLVRMADMKCGITGVHKSCTIWQRRHGNTKTHVPK